MLAAAGEAKGLGLLAAAGEAKGLGLLAAAGEAKGLGEVAGVENDEAPPKEAPGVGILIGLTGVPKGFGEGVPRPMGGVERLAEMPTGATLPTGLKGEGLGGPERELPTAGPNGLPEGPAIDPAIFPGLPNGLAGLTWDASKRACGGESLIV